VLRRLRVENFMSCQDTTVDLKPLTVSVGANASGKSTIFKALVFLSRLQNGVPLRGGSKGEFQLEPGVTLDQLVRNGNTSLPIRFQLWFDEDPFCQNRVRHRLFENR